MAYKHGVYIQENPTSIIPPVKSDSAVQVAVGTAPINLAENPYGATNKPILTYSLKEASKSLGYSDSWKDYTLCEVMNASYMQIGVAPIVFINVLDPTTHKTSGSEVTTIVDGETKVTAEGILLDTVKVKSEDSMTTYVKDADYSIAFNSSGEVIVSIISTGSIAGSSVSVEYEILDASLVTTDDIIGGYDSVNDSNLGLELIKEVYPRFGIVPGQILCPGWSHNPSVAAVMDVKSKDINGTFNCVNLLDLDTSTVKKYSDVPAWKNDNSYTSKKSIALWPKVKIGDKTYHYSSVMAALIAKIDSNNDNVPYVSPSNKRLPITGAVLDDGKEVFLEHNQANFLNQNGIVTTINTNGWRTWGNNTAAYPSTTDPKDRFIAIRRVFDWWGNTFILTYFQEVDDPTNYRLIESIVDSENIRGNGLQAQGMIAGAKIEFREEDNPITSILDGRIQFIQKIAAFPPAKEIINVLEFDPQILSSSLFGGDM